MKIAIIGASYAGIAAANRARYRYPQAEICLFESQAHVGIKPAGIANLSSAQTANENLVKLDLGVVLKLASRVIAIDSQASSLTYLESEAGPYQYQYDYLILAMGSQQVESKLREDFGHFIIDLSNQDSRQASRKILDRSQSILVVGGGQVGLEAASYLAGIGKTVTLVEANDQLAFKYFDQAIADAIKNILTMQGVKVVTSTSYHKLDLVGDHLAVHCQNQTFLTDALYIANQVQPNNGLIRDQLVLDMDGTIKTDAYMQTSVTNIFACGDLVKVNFADLGQRYYQPLVSHALLTGQIAADNLTFPRQAMPQVYRTTVMDLGNYQIFSCGLTKTEADYYFTNVTSCYQSDGYHIFIMTDSYYGALRGLQVIAPKDDPGLRAIIGQATTAIQNQLTINQLCQQANVLVGQDLVYCPAWCQALWTHQDLIKQVGKEGLSDAIESVDG